MDLERGLLRMEWASVEIAENVRKACEMRDAETHFDYDAMNLQTSDAHTIARLASCLSDGPLIGHQIQLVGCGELIDENNQSRAGTAADILSQALVERRVALSRISIAMLGRTDVCRAHQVYMTLRD